MSGDDDNDVKVEPEFSSSPSDNQTAEGSYSDDNNGESMAGSRFTEERERSRKLRNDSANENLTRKRWGRFAGLAFMSLFSVVTIGMIVAVTCLVYKLVVAFSIQLIVPTPFATTNIWSHAIPLLPVFSLSLFALLMFITLARFATDFINEERRGGSQSNSPSDDNDEAAAIRVLKKLLSALGGGK